MWVSFVPFPTALMGDYPASNLAVMLYGVIMLLVALSFYAMRRVVLNEGTEVHPSVDLPAFRKATRGALLMGALPYAASTVLAAFVPKAAMAVYMVIPVYFALPRRQSS